MIKGTIRRFRLLEAKQDMENLKQAVGNEVANTFMELRTKLRAPQNDIYHWIEKVDGEWVEKEDNGEEVSLEEFVNSFESKSQKTKAAKEEGAELVVNEDGFKVYFITTYDAAVKYGANTKWCITGNYDNHTEQGQYYFDNYKDKLGLDGYYFMITPDNHKFCFLVNREGNLVSLTTESIWDETDKSISIYDFLDMYE